LQDALDRNRVIQEKKKRDFDERQEAGAKRAGEKAVELVEEVKQQAEERKKKVDTRVKVCMFAQRRDHTVSDIQTKTFLPDGCR
jgi:hypothetical protein